ncbi:polysaccharide deacetylase family protein [Clostridium sp. OS1-26]|uniref:polysaccharide deacetylase family protein n=1 Tax=Clostridium sp. OS1-26 TaxID=3070681 RepID=UPI0027E0FC9F|nr:polysaccharide deacetylase family protein [Clostridium sp. OS1-26]WML32585.1 polysaccharide deacetylase family protein [Clostridium sp. OS1-26]
MKLFKKNIVMIIILVSGILLTWQVLSKNKRMHETALKDKYRVNEYKLPQKVNKDIPDLKGGPESSTRSTEHNPASTRVFYSSSNRSIKQVALTFDDGPDIYYTPQILEILKKYNVKATFFIVGLRAQAHPEMVRRIVSEGHSIGNHTWDHPNLPKLPTDKVREEVQKTEQLLYSITGFNTAMFRPPYGSANAQVIDEVTSLGYKIIDWSVDTRDWAKTPTPQIMNYVSKEVYPGGIILQHCAGGKSEDLSNTVKALPQIISSLRSQGYSFVMVQDLLDISASK